MSNISSSYDFTFPFSNLSIEEKNECFVPDPYKWSVDQFIQYVDEGDERTVKEVIGSLNGSPLKPKFLANYLICASKKDLTSSSLNKNFLEILKALNITIDDAIDIAHFFFSNQTRATFTEAKLLLDLFPHSTCPHHHIELVFLCLKKLSSSAIIHLFSTITNEKELHAQYIRTLQKSLPISQITTLTYQAVHWAQDETDENNKKILFRNALNFMMICVYAHDIRIADLIEEDGFRDSLSRELKENPKSAATILECLKKSSEDKLCSHNPSLVKEIIHVNPEALSILWGDELLSISKDIEKLKERIELPLNHQEICILRTASHKISEELIDPNSGHLTLIREILNISSWVSRHTHVFKIHKFFLEMIKEQSHLPNTRTLSVQLEFFNVLKDVLDRLKPNVYKLNALSANLYKQNQRLLANLNELYPIQSEGEDPEIVKEAILYDFIKKLCHSFDKDSSIEGCLKYHNLSWDILRSTYLKFDPDTLKKSLKELKSLKDI